MKRGNARRFSLLAAILAVAGGLPGVALGWAGGTHGYIAKHTDFKAGLTSADELCNRIYGANAVDLFNLDMSQLGQRLADIVHGQGNVTAAEAWAVVTAMPNPADVDLAFAYGFSTHNDGWGTDSTAHWSGITQAKNRGYVIAKAELFRALLPPEAVAYSGIPEALLPLVSHLMVEYAVDLLLADVDASLGAALAQSAACPVPADPAVLFGTLVPEVEVILNQFGIDPGLAPAVVGNADAVSRWLVSQLGGVLSLPTAGARHDAMAGLLSQLAPVILGPGGKSPEELKPVIAQMLGLGKMICAPDFKDEIDATIGRVNGKMNSLGISP
jgi:hypothetical protein